MLLEEFIFVCGPWVWREKKRASARISQMSGILVSTQFVMFVDLILLADEHVHSRLFWQILTEAYWKVFTSHQFSHAAELSLFLDLWSLQLSGKFVANFLVTTMCLNTALPD